MRMNKCGAAPGLRKIYRLGPAERRNFLQSPIEKLAARIGVLRENRRKAVRGHEHRAFRTDLGGSPIEIDAVNVIELISYGAAKNIGEHRDRSRGR